FDIAGRGVEADEQAGALAPRLWGYAGEEVLAVAREGQRLDIIAAGRFQGEPILARRGVPKPDHFLRAGRRNRFSVRTESNSVDRAIMPGVSEDLVTVGQVPDLDHARSTEEIAAAGGETLPVRAKGDGEDRLAVAQARVADDACEMLGRGTGR